MKKLLALLLALSLVFALAACGGKGQTDAVATDEAETTIEDITEETTAEEATDEDATAAEETTVADDATTAEETTAEETTAEDGEKKVPETKEEIVAAYTEVMNQAKTDGPGFTKVEWQVLPDDDNSRVINEGKLAVSAALKAAESFMTSESKAKGDPEIREKGNDMHSWPVCNTPKGSMLTDASCVKSAKCEVLPDGNYKITLVLNSENNPEPAAKGSSTSPSNTGKVFNPLSKADIDDTLNNNSIVTTVAKDITYSLTYHDCTAVLVYNPENNHVVSLDQTMKVAIKGAASVIGIKLDIEKQELIDYMKIYDLKY